MTLQFGSRDAFFIRCASPWRQATARHDHHRSTAIMASMRTFLRKLTPHLSTAEMTIIQQVLVKKHPLDKDRIKLGTWDASSNDAIKRLLARAPVTKAYDQAGDKIDGVDGQKPKKLSMRWPVPV